MATHETCPRLSLKCNRSSKSRVGHQGNVGSSSIKLRHQLKTSRGKQTRTNLWSTKRLQVDKGLSRSSQIPMDQEFTWHKRLMRWMR